MNVNIYIKKSPTALFYQRMVGLKPKGMICDLKDSCLIVILKCRDYIILKTITSILVICASQRYFK